jgi:hypothetical protein
MIQDLVLMGETKDWSQQQEEERPRCATCGKPLSARGEQTRWIQTTGGGSGQVDAYVWHLPKVGGGFFPAFMRS